MTSEGLFDFVDDAVSLMSKYLRESPNYQKHYPKLVFFCGKQILDENLKPLPDQCLLENKRKYLIDIVAHYSTIHPIISEKLYNFEKYKIDLLTFEQLLGELSDNIIIVLESDGTKCELGAFSLDNVLFEKLYVINDQKHKDSNSFISNGPIKKIQNNDSDRLYYCDFEDFDKFKADRVLKEMLSIIDNSRIRIEPSFMNPEVEVKQLLFQIINIVDLLCPIDEKSVSSFYKKITGNSKYKIKNESAYGIKSIKNILDLAEKLELIISEIGPLGKLYSSIDKIKTYDVLFDLTEDKFYSLKSDIIGFKERRHL